MFEHDGVSYVRAIEANRGALCAREVFQGAQIFDNLLDKTTTGALACSSKNSTIRSGAIQSIQRDFAQLLLMQPRLKGFFAFQKSASLKLEFTSKGVPLDEFKRCAVKAVILRINYRHFVPSLHTLLRTTPSTLLTHFNRETALVEDFVLNSLPGMFCLVKPGFYSSCKSYIDLKCQLEHLKVHPHQMNHHLMTSTWSQACFSSSKMPCEHMDVCESSLTVQNKQHLHGPPTTTR